MISLIAVVGKNLELGYRGGLCFNLPSDLEFFKQTTMGHPILMGLNTWKSLPGKLPGRTNYVLAKNVSDLEDLPEEVKLITDLEGFLKNFENSKQELFVIGGASVYRQCLNKCQTLFLTEVEAEAKADVFFPEFNKDNYKREVLTKGEDYGVKFTHVKYQLK